MKCVIVKWQLGIYERGKWTIMMAIYEGNYVQERETWAIMKTIYEGDYGQV